MVEGAPTLVAGKQPRRAAESSRPFFMLRRLRRDQRGVAVVEFALVAIPLFLIVFGILDFGRALQYYNDLTQIAGQGARAAAVNQNPQGGVANGSFQNQLACEATPGELRSRVAVKVLTPLPANPGDPVTVQASFVFNFFPYLTQYVGMTITATQTERYESSTIPPGFSNLNDVTNGGSGC
jgi:Flp pilus assembly protein TadG